MNWEYTSTLRKTKGKTKPKSQKTEYSPLDTYTVSNYFPSEMTEGALL